MQRIRLCGPPRCGAYGIVCSLLVLLVPPGAWAGDTWSKPFTGVRYLKRTTTKPWRIHALVVDLCAAGISVRATGSSERRKTVPAFAAAVGAEAAINGDFFSFSTYSTSGFAMHGGKAWSGTKDSKYSGMLAFGAERALVDAPSNAQSAAPSWMKEVVSGHPHIVTEGKPKTSWSGSSLCSARHPRTAAGLSEDRQTLYLAVVDGRSSASVGMTCGELAKLMQGLGAHNAVNLDGGGSSTMWIRGKGVVNRPSDGTARVVANHLAIQATGKGAPAHCDPERDEITLPADGASWSSSTDIDGDGRADVCARTAGEFRCHVATGNGFGPAISGPKLTDDSGWNDLSNYATIRIGDIDGDGRADLCARANAGMRCWAFTGAGFGPAITGPALADADGWNQPRYFSTIRLADFDGDGRADLCARSSAGFDCYPSTGTGFGAAVAGPKLADASGWGAPASYATIRMGDVNGDGRADVCARATSGMSCWLSDGAGFPTKVAGPEWSDAKGWGDIKHWSTIRLVDVTGDGKADLCGRGSTGFRCHVSAGTSFGAAKDAAGLSDESGWWRNQYYSTIRLADVDGDGDRDLCARGNKGIFCWPWSAAGFGASFAGPAWSNAAGWDAAAHHRTIRFGDLNRDGKADICGRGAAGVQCALSDGAGFATTVEGPAWADASGWNKAGHYATIRLSGVGCTPSDEICDGKDNDCDGQADEDLDCTASEQEASAAGEGGVLDFPGRGAAAAPDDPDGSLLIGGNGCSMARATPDACAWLLLLAALLLRRRPRLSGAGRGAGRGDR